MRLVNIIASLVVASAILSAKAISVDIRPKNYSGSIKFIKQVELKYNFNGYNFSEISDLAYNPAKHLLYMVSDKGSIFTFSANFTDNNFTLKPLRAAYFKRKNGKRLKHWKRDTEGIALDSAGQIFISREGKPRVTLFDSNGKKIKNLKLPKALKKAKLRSRNKSLESLAYHPQYGLLTALEWPPKGTNLHYQTIYALSGKKWHFKTQAYKKNGVAEVEVMDDGNLLVLERAYNGYFGKFVVTLKKVFINNCQTKICPSKVLLSIDSAKDWHVENFEGLAKIAKNRYLLVSDDNDSFFLRTILIYLEIE